MRKWTPLKRHPGIFEYDTKSGKKYGIRKDYTDAYHKHKSWSKSGFTNWRDADIMLKQFELKLQNGELQEAMNHSVTLESYYKQLIDRRIKLNLWRPATVTQKENYWKNHISPHFGKMKIGDITRQSYQHFIDGMVTDGFAKNTIITTNSVMQVIMNDAAQNDVIAKNRLSGISIDGGESPSSKTLSEDEYNTLMKAAKEILSKYELGVVLLLTLGERREELLGLQYDSFQFSNWNNEKICAITFKCGRTIAEPTGGPLKNDSSYRTIYVRGEMCQLCHYMITYSKNVCANAHRQIEKDSFLLVDEHTGMPFGIQKPNKILTKIGTATKIHITPHIFRHYFATMALTNGQVATDVMHWLGHSSLDMTQSYTRENIRGALNVFDGMEPTLLDNKTDKQA